jgi:hypothetical protein
MIERIKDVVEQIMNRLPSVRGKGEEATKQAIVRVCPTFYTAECRRIGCGANPKD